MTRPYKCYPGTDEPIRFNGVGAVRALLVHYGAYAGWTRSPYWTWRRAGGEHVTSRSTACDAVCCGSRCDA